MDIMMPIHFEGANALYGKPKDMSDEQCMTVSALEIRDEKNNIREIRTVWQPNKEDIEAINAGRPIVMSIHGGGLPPALLFTYDENGHPNI